MVIPSETALVYFDTSAAMSREEVCVKQTTSATNLDLVMGQETKEKAEYDFLCSRHAPMNTL